MLTSSSVLHMLFALLWCALLAASTVGWGSLLLRPVSRVQDREWGSTSLELLAHAIAGLALLSFVGGVLNLFQAIVPAALDFLVLGGALLAAVAYGPALWRAVRLRNRRPGARPETAALILVLLAIALFAFRYASTVHRTGYMGVDDYEAYLVFPAKMLATHHFAADPFNERRLQSSIGIPYFLQTLLLARLPLACVQMVDQGIGVCFLALAGIAAGRVFRLSRTRLAVFVLVALAMPHIRFNLTMTTLPTALLLGMGAVAAGRDALPRRSWMPPRPSFPRR